MSHTFEFLMQSLAQVIQSRRPIGTCRKATHSGSGNERMGIDEKEED
jgi:hypothetical protein